MMHVTHRVCKTPLLRRYNTATKPVVVIQGSVGQLGQAVVSKFGSNNWTIISVDPLKNTNTHHSFVLGKNEAEDAKAIVEYLKNQAPDVVISVAGGWAGGDIGSPELFDSLNSMLHMNVHSAVMASHIASRSMKKGGLLVLTGASAALGPTPGMISYGIAKAATHHLVSSLANSDAMPEGSTTIAILPSILDTPSNRSAMPDADKSTWTPTTTVADEIFKWASDASKRPKNGSLVKLVTNNNKTEFVAE